LRVVYSRRLFSTKLGCLATSIFFNVISTQKITSTEGLVTPLYRLHDKTPTIPNTCPNHQNIFELEIFQESKFELLESGGDDDAPGVVVTPEVE
jgi:hypothetical protein